MASLEEVLNSLKIATGNKIAVESDWISENLRTFPVVSFEKERMRSPKKTYNFLKSPKVANLL